MVELMVALVIGLIVSPVIFSVMSTSEGRKRTLMAGNDMNQMGAFTLFQLDRAIRSAGSGFAQSFDQSYGCLLNVTKNGVNLLPVPTLPAPFSHLATTSGGLRVAPVIIARNEDSDRSDVLITMAGSAGDGEMATEAFNAPLPGVLRLFNTVSIHPQDLLLQIDRADATGVTPCLVEQVDLSFDREHAFNKVPLGGPYATPAGVSKSLISYSADSSTVNLGKSPQFQAFGIDANSSFFSYDLLKVSGSAPVAIADNVLIMRALYGVSDAVTGAGGTALTWVDPRVNTLFAATPSGLMSGTSTAANRIKSIRAIRLALIVRSVLKEKPDPVTGNAVSPGNLSLFVGVPGITPVTVPLSEEQRNFRCRVLEATIPVRNALLLP